MEEVLHYNAMTVRVRLIMLEDNKCLNILKPKTRLYHEINEIITLSGDSWNYYSEFLCLGAIFNGLGLQVKHVPVTTRDVSKL